MNIGFDLDKIFIDNPPFIPLSLINALYGEHSNGHLSYRIPGKIEQYIRKLSHAPFFRPPIKENIALLGKYAQHKKNFFLISSRFGFLTKETNKIIKINHLNTLFSSMTFNPKNEQPHFFKDRIITKQHIDIFIDDDLPLLRFLAPRHPQISFFWFNKNIHKKINNSIQAITRLDRIFENI